MAQTKRVKSEKVCRITGRNVIVAPFTSFPQPAPAFEVDWLSASRVVSVQALSA
jgi:hypothetical protein